MKMWFFHSENHESVLYYKQKKLKGAIDHERNEIRRNSN